MSNASILLVDDCAMVRDLLKRSLEGVGFSVFCVASGDDALEILQEREIDAVVLDLKMPVMSGQTLFHVIIGKWPSLKSHVLIMTGDSRAEENQAWLRLYDLPVLKKPFALDELTSLLNALTSSVPDRLEALG